MDQHSTGSSDPRSIGDIASSILENAQEIFRDEIRLAKVELREDLMRAARAAAMLVAGAVLGLFAFGMLLFTATWALDRILPLWAAAGIVATVVALCAVILITVGRSRISEVNPKPEKTVETMKENVQWLRQQTH